MEESITPNLDSTEVSNTEPKSVLPTATATIQSELDNKKILVECKSDEDSVMSGDSKIEFQLNIADLKLFTQKLECNRCSLILKQIVASDEITSKKYEDLMKGMTNQLSPKPSKAVRPLPWTNNAK